MIDTVALKSAIIDLAVNGQLSSQFHTTDSVADIIAALPPLSIKRKRLIGQSFDYGKQATLPKHWKWIRLGELSSYGDTPKKVNFDDVSGDTWILDLEDIQSGGRIIEKARVNDKKFIGDKTVFYKGQVLYSKLRPYLKKVLVADEDGVSTPELISFDVFGGISPQYIMYCLLSSFTDRAIEKRSYGIKMPRVDAGFMVNLPIPVPPLSEQYFIVERIESAILQIDTIDKLQAQYADNLTALKSKLIDAAIQGKLTKQIPEDGTAEELFQQIQAEKQRLISEGKIKKEKPLPEISEEEIPFDIPDNWKWVRLNGISLKITDGTHHSPPNSSEGDYMYVTAKNIKESGVNLDNITFVSKDIHQEIYSRCNPEIGDVLLIKDGATTGVTTVNDIKEPFSMLSSVALIKTMPRIEPWYIVYALRSSWFYSYIRGEMTGVGITRVVLKQINSFIVPLPPLAEQKRIVQKLEQILPLCEIKN